ncbi:MAG: XRE family transcriptional regulator [Candidatus Tumulicola sp.]
MVRPERLKWARESTMLTLEDAAKKMGVSAARLAAAEGGSGSITFRQLEKLAHACGIPMHILYSDAPPKEEELPIDFRSPQEGGGEFSSGLIKTLRIARERRDAALDLFGDLDMPRTKLPVLRNDKEIAEYLRGLLCVLEWNHVSTDERKELWKGAKALSLTKELVETNLPVLVFEFIIDPKFLRGCSLYSDGLSIVALSTRDKPNARRFTMGHELAHLLMRESGICYPIRGRISNVTERRCNLVAGEALLPTELLAHDIEEKSHIAIDSLIEYLANRYCLSYSAVAVRLNQFGALSATQLQQRLQTYAQYFTEERERSSESEAGPSYHLLQVQRLGPTFTNAILSAVDSDYLSISQAAHLLQISPSYDNVSKIREKAVSVYGSR